MRAPRETAERISIHALREEGDLGAVLQRHLPSISIHALREEGDLDKKRYHQSVENISIHALREEGDSVLDFALFGDIIFLSTPSARRATNGMVRIVKSYQISIHALREEGDTVHSGNTILLKVFLSTPSARRATATAGLLYRRSSSISIHALREEGDQ